MSQSPGALPASPVPLLPPPRVPAGGSTESLPRSHDWSAIVRWLEEGHAFLLTTHVNPDADGLGSLAALAMVLRDKGKHVVVALPTPMPDPCRFLFASLDAKVCEDPATLDALLVPGMDRAIILDVSGLKRVGEVASHIQRLNLPTLVLDHHLANEMDGLVAVFPGLSSTGEVVAGLLAFWEVAPSPAVAQALFAALTTDTGGFAFSSTTGDTLELAAALVRAGARPERVHFELEQNYPAARYDLMSLFLASRRSHAGGRLLEFQLGDAMLEQACASREDAEGFPNLGLGIKGCEISIIISEQRSGAVKLNLRCVAPHDVCAIARAFGGGGHRFAAGATLEAGQLDGVELRERVLALALAQLEEGAA
jgi:phosphoesterase RecJ-like protein